VVAVTEDVPLAVPLGDGVPDAVAVADPRALTAELPVAVALSVACAEKRGSKLFDVVAVTEDVPLAVPHGDGVPDAVAAADSHALAEAVADPHALAAELPVPVALSVACAEKLGSKLFEAVAVMEDVPLAVPHGDGVPNAVAVADPHALAVALSVAVVLPVAGAENLGSKLFVAVAVTETVPLAVPHGDGVPVAEAVADTHALTAELPVPAALSVAGTE
jgi:hypothetical protein